MMTKYTHGKPIDTGAVVQAFNACGMEDFPFDGAWENGRFRFRSAALSF